MQDAALVAMRSEVVAEVTNLRNQELEQALQQLRQQLQQQVRTSFITLQCHMVDGSVVTHQGMGPICLHALEDKFA